MVNTMGGDADNKKQRTTPPSMLERVGRGFNKGLNTASDAVGKAVGTLRHHARGAVLATVLTAKALSGVDASEPVNTSAVEEVDKSQSKSSALDNADFLSEPNGKRITSSPENENKIKEAVAQFKSKTGLPLDVFYTEGKNGPVVNVDLRETIKSANSRPQILTAGLGDLGLFESIGILIAAAISLGASGGLAFLTGKFALAGLDKKEERLDKKESDAQEKFNKESDEWRAAEKALADFEVANPGWASNPAQIAQHAALFSRRNKEQGEKDAAERDLLRIRNAEIPKFEKGKNWRKVAVVLAALAGLGGSLPLASQFWPEGETTEEAAKRQEKEEFDKRKRRGEKEAEEAAKRAAERARARRESGEEGGGSKGKGSRGGAEDSDEEDSGADTDEQPTKELTTQEKAVEVIFDFTSGKTTVTAKQAKSACATLMMDPDFRDSVKEVCKEVK